MRKLVFTAMGVLAMTSSGLAEPVLSVVWEPDPGPMLRSFTVQATGIGINQLANFTISGKKVNQISTNSAWTSDGTAGGPTDSYVMFGDLRLCDVQGRRGAERITSETIETTYDE